MFDQLRQVAQSLAAAVERREVAGAALPSLLEFTLDTMLADYGPDVPRPEEAIELGQRWDDLVEVCRLAPFEEFALGAAAAAEMDPNFALIYGILAGSSRPGGITAGLVVELTGTGRLGPGRAALGTGGSLQRYGLAGLVGDGPFPTRQLSIADRVARHLSGDDAPDPLSELHRIEAVPMTFTATRALTAAIEAGSALCYVSSPPGTAGVALVAGALVAGDMRYLTLDLATVPAGSQDAVLRAGLLEAIVTRSALAVKLAEDEPGDLRSALVTLSEPPVPVVLVGDRPWDARRLPYLPPTVSAEALSDAGRVQLWQALTADLPGLAEAEFPRFRLTPEQMRDVATRVRADAEAADADARPEDLRAVAAQVAVPAGLPPGLRRSSPTVRFDDLTLPDRTRRALLRIAGRYRLRGELLRGDGFLARSAKGRGVAALFTGPPGTGKSLAAHALAAELHSELLTVDLAAMVDKYIGETEKNLERAFALAEVTGGVLFFDEADALFGSRSKVNEARDKYANQETAWLLQRLEAFDGLAILATNLRGNLDAAFTRRLSFFVHFDTPDRGLRATLWRTHLGEGSELSAEVEVEIDLLAEHAELSGGEIRNAALDARYEALGEGRPLEPSDLRRAVAGEFEKLGRRMPPIPSVPIGEGTPR